MAIAPTCVWEVRTTGSDTNGGGFVAGTGTDYSVQDAPQLAVTDAVANGTTTLTSATGGFTAAMVGNVVYLAGGTGSLAGTPRQITAVNSATSVTVDAAVAAGTGLAANVGGALASPAVAAARKTYGNKVFWKAGAYSITGTTPNTTGGPVNDATGGSDTSWSRWVGYSTTRTYPCPDATRPVLTVAAGLSGVTAFAMTAGTMTELHNVVIDCNSQATSRGVQAGFASHVSKCKVANCTNSGIVLTSSQSAIFGCEVTGCTAAGSGINANYNPVAGCHVHDNAVSGMVNASNVTRSLVVNNTGASSVGIGTGGNGDVNVSGCTVAGNGSHGLDLSFQRGGFVAGVLSYGNGGYGFAGASGSSDAGYLWRCAAGSNTSGASVNSAGIDGLVALTADPFVSSAGGNYALNAAAGGGAACRAASYPGGAYPGSATTGYADIGAVQHADPAASGGSGYCSLQGVG